MVSGGPNPRRVIDVGNMSPEDAELFLAALRNSILDCEDLEREAGADAEGTVHVTPYHPKGS